MSVFQNKNRIKRHKVHTYICAIGCTGGVWNIWQAVSSDDPRTLQKTGSARMKIQYKKTDFCHPVLLYNWVDLVDRLRVCESDRIGGAGLCLQPTWKEPATTNGRGEHTGNDARVVGVTHDLSMPQMSCPYVTPPPTPPTHTRSHMFPFFFPNPSFYSQMS